MKHWESCECRKCDRKRIEDLQAEVDRLRQALEVIERRATGRGNGAAVVVTTQTLGAIARQALEEGDYE
jgi:hypothetical protein